MGGDDRGLNIEMDRTRTLPSDNLIYLYSCLGVNTRVSGGQHARVYVSRGIFLSQINALSINNYQKTPLKYSPQARFSRINA